MNRPSILVLDNDQELINSVYSALSVDYEVIGLTNPLTATLTAQQRHFDVIVVDYQIADVNSLDFIRVLRPYQPNTVIILTAYSPSIYDVQQALRMHVNDFLFKPFPIEELRRQITLALMQRMPRHPPAETIAAPPRQSNIIIGPLQINVEHRVVEWHGETLLLTPTEFCIIYTLSLFLGQYVLPSVLIEKCRNYKIDDSEAGELLKPHIANLRAKLEKDGAYPRIIMNRRSLGFMLDTSHITNL
jgi:DNA-binding response OmpR family regulator